MYHYVRENSEEYPFSRYKGLQDFIREVSFIKKTNSFLNTSDAINEKNLKNHKNIVILTFDDGLKDHLKVAELLKEKNISATFYISTNPLTKRKLLHVHKAHLITSKFGPESINILKKVIDNLNLSLEEFENKNEKNIFQSRYDAHNDFDEIKLFKKIINYYGSIGLRDQLLDEILRIKNIKSDVNSFYLTKKEINYISSLGFEIGSHGVSHNPMSRLKEKAQFEELKISKKFLENIIKKPITSFCYPYGRKNSYNQVTINFLRENNYKNAITVDYRDISDKDINNKYEIPRYDCNEIKKIFNI
tara:strand:- start:593 stop:1504 length:912 start_codon:yes stop_codon:yes gene_type:complete